MTGWRKWPLLLLSLLMLAGPLTFAPVAALLPPAPGISNDEEDPSARTELTLAVDVGQHGRRPCERPAALDRRLILHPPRRHHAPAVNPLTLPAPFRATVNPPLHC
jgi:hypothetical protein